MLTAARRLPVAWGLILCCVSTACADEPVDPPLRDVPSRFIVDYPAAERFCPPTRTAFVDAASSFALVKESPVAVPPNGGYGLEFKQRGRVLYHTGADIGWFREDQPVFAVADGVVRFSQSGIRARAAEEGRRLPGGPLDYGNLIIIEHRTKEGEYFCSLYGHLGSDRAVEAGDLVTVGQQIGTIGKKGLENGGYDPHLHFGIRNRAVFEPGGKLLDLTVNGEPAVVELVELGELSTRVTVMPEPGRDLNFTFAGQSVPMTAQESGYLLPSWVLYYLPGTAPDFPGYAASLKGWTDPIVFLRGHGAEGSTVEPLFVTCCRNEKVERRYAVGQPAPSWHVAEWLRADDPAASDVTDLRGKVIVLFCFDPNCKGSQTHGLPALREVGRHFFGDTDVAVVGLYVPTARRRTGRSALNEIVAQLPARTCIGQCGVGGEDAEILNDYQICGTPWLVLIDAEGIIQFSNYVVSPEEIVRRVEELQRLP